MNIIIFLIILFPWFLSGILFPYNAEFFNSLNRPWFTPPPIIFAVIWPILYFLIALSFYLIIKNNKQSKNYLFSYLLNYILNQTFSLFFFYLNNLSLTLYNILFLFISTIYLLIKSKLANKTSFYLLIPYLLWIIFATILFTTIFFIN